MKKKKGDLLEKQELAAFFVHVTGCRVDSREAS